MVNGIMQYSTFFSLHIKFAIELVAFLIFSGLNENRGNAPNEGELLLWGRCIMMGYVNQLEATEAALFGDGSGSGNWLQTGDLIKLEQDGVARVAGKINYHLNLYTCIRAFIF